MGIVRLANIRALSALVNPPVPHPGGTGVGCKLAAMSYKRRSHCADCGASGNDVRISKRGYCPTCGQKRLLDNVRAMQEGQGTTYNRWVLAQAEALAARLANTPDDTNTP